MLSDYKIESIRLHSTTVNYIAMKKLSLNRLHHHQHLSFHHLSFLIWMYFRNLILEITLNCPKLQFFRWTPVNQRSSNHRSITRTSKVHFLKILWIFPKFPVLNSQFCTSMILASRYFFSFRWEICYDNQSNLPSLGSTSYLLSEVVEIPPN